MNSEFFEGKIGYKFINSGLLLNALTHSSYTNEANRGKSNERLEFLGDAIFDAVISDFLYSAFPDYEEGKLSKLRATIVCEASLAVCGRGLVIHENLILGRGEEHTGGRERDSIIADAMEAVIGAIFLDGGYGAAKEFVLYNFKKIIDQAISGKINKDYKSQLQEKLQSDGILNIKYSIEKEEGPEHDKKFHTVIRVDGEVRGRGSGRNKKEAEQHAAREALEVIEGEAENVL